MFSVANLFNIHNFLLGNDLEWTGFRAWHLYVNYFDYGFIKRGFIGTLFHILNVPNIIGNEFIFVKASTFISAFAMISISTLYMHSNNLLEKNKLLLMLLLFSPATMHFFAWDGNLDNFILIIFLIAFLFTKNTWIQAFLIFIGLLSHETFAFFIPILFFFNLIQNDKNISLFLFDNLPNIISALIAIILILLFGDLSMNKNEYFLSMSHKIPLIFNLLQSQGSISSDMWWSGYNEISYSVGEYLSEALSIQKLLANYVYTFPATVVCIIYPIICSVYLKKNFLHKLGLFIALMFPFFMIFLANDYYRYTSFVIFLSIIFLIKGYTHDLINNIPKKYLLCLLSLCILGPYGSSTLNRPFFVFQALIAKLFADIF